MHHASRPESHRSATAGTPTDEMTTDSVAECSLVTRKLTKMAPTQNFGLAPAGSPESRACLAVLPTELHILIARHLDMPTALALARVSRHFYRSIDAHELVDGDLQRDFVQARDRLQRNVDLYACYGCCRLKPKRFFADGQRRAKSSVPGYDQTRLMLRRCFDCAVRQSTYPHLAPVRRLGVTYYPCHRCLRWGTKSARCRTEARSADDSAVKTVCYPHPPRAMARAPLVALPDRLLEMVVREMGYDDALRLDRASRYLHDEVQPAKWVPLHEKFRFVRARWREGMMERQRRGVDRELLDESPADSGDETTEPDRQGAENSSSQESHVQLLNADEAQPPRELLPPAEYLHILLAKAAGSPSKLQGLTLPCYACLRIRPLERFTLWQQSLSRRHPGTYYLRRCHACVGRLYRKPAPEMALDRWRQQVLCTVCDLARHRDRDCEGCAELVATGRLAELPSSARAGGHEDIPGLKDGERQRYRQAAEAAARAGATNRVGRYRGLASIGEMLAGEGDWTQAQTGNGTVITEESEAGWTKAVWRPGVFVRAWSYVRRMVRVMMRKMRR